MTKAQHREIDLRKANAEYTTWEREHRNASRARRAKKQKQKPARHTKGGRS